MLEGFAEDHFFRRGRMYLIKYVQAGRNVDTVKKTSDIILVTRVSRMNNRGRTTRVER